MNRDWSQGQGLKEDKITYHQRQRISYFEGKCRLKVPILCALLHCNLQQEALCSVDRKRQFSPHPGACNYVKTKCPSISLLPWGIIQKFPYSKRREYIYTPPSSIKDDIYFVFFVALINILLFPYNSTHSIK